MNQAEPEPVAIAERMLPYVQNADHALLEYGWMAYHRAIYQIIAQYSHQQRLLDVGCGSGYGIATVARVSQTQVWGSDIAYDAAAFATRTYPALSGRMLVCDVLQLACRPGQFDLVTAVEVIEHVPSPERFLGELTRVMHPRGQCIVSTPNRLVVSPDQDRPVNPYHAREFSYDELNALLSQIFRQVRLYSIRIAHRVFLVRYLPQGVRVKPPFPLAHVERYLYWHMLPWKNRRASLRDIIITPGYVPQCTGFLAICAEPMI